VNRKEKLWTEILENIVLDGGAIGPRIIIN